MADQKLNKRPSSLEELEILLITGNYNCLKGVTDDMIENNCHNGFVDKLSILCNFVIEADYGSVLSSTVLNDILDGFAEVIQGSPQENLKNVRNCIDHKASDCDHSSIAAEYILLLIGVSALQEFVRCNWTGPNQNKTKTYKLLDFFFSSSSDLPKNILSSCGESIYQHVNYPELLLCSKMILAVIKEDYTLTQNWWSMRCLMIHQHILSEKSGHLHDEIKALVDQIDKSSNISKNPTLQLQFNIECGFTHLFYHEIIPAKSFFTRAQSLLGLEMEVSGALAKRTQFQTKAVAQLLVRLQKNFSSRKNGFVSNNMPKDVKLEDEVLLEKVKFIDDEDNIVENLVPEEQLLILSHCCLLQKSDASDELLTEKLMAFIECLLSQPIVWSIQMKALIMRSKLEQHKSRKVERAMKQYEMLLSELREDTSNLKERLSMFYSVIFPPVWIIEKHLADLLFSLGATKSALEVYLRLDLWEDIVKCYKSLGLGHKAAEIVQQQLDNGQSPLLWCILGDVTENIECYEKAWELSGQRNARSQSSLGYFYYKKKEYEKCIEYFERSLKINHLQLNVWFSLAFAAMRIEKYELAAQAYRHVVTIDPDNFEAWNNLSNVYIRLNQKQRAYRTLQEAIKCSFENWKIWENFLLVCMDIGAFEEAIHGYHRLLDLKGKHEDIQVLSILIQAIKTDVLDINGLKSSRLRTKTQTLFGRLTSLIPNNADIWKLYASLNLTAIENMKSTEGMERIVAYQQKAHKFSIQESGWERNVPVCKLIISHAIELGENYICYIQLLEGNLKNQTKSSARLMLKNLLVRVEKQLCDLNPADAEDIGQLLERLRETLSNVETVL